LSLNKLWSEAVRRFYFFKYNVQPFRLSLFLAHTHKRLASTLGYRRGFRIIDLAITYRCNQLCAHCSAQPLAKEAPTLTLSDYARIVEDAQSLDLLSWNITGGEPLLTDWLEDLIPVLRPQTHYISVQTNCTLLTAERARRLKELGVNCITTSIDSSFPEEHNSFRGMAGAYNKTLAGIRIARKAGLQVLVGGTVTHKNLRSQDLERLIQKINQEGAIFLYNLAVPCGKWSNNLDMVLRDDDRQYLQSLLTRFPRSSTDHEVGRNAIGCPAGMEKVYITPYGEVIPCPFIHVSFGNVKETPLPAIIQRMRTVPYFAEYQKICLAAEDPRFNEAVIAPIAEHKGSCPVWYEKIFGAHEND
jgi:MoaA/NifB/PqqE/SkfB family radical SAM enzyme